MTAKRTLRQVVCGWLYRIVTLPGWHRWAALAAAVLLFLIAALSLARRTDYREDPSALVPRSADLYAEVRDLPGFLKTVGGWTLLREGRRGGLERELAGLIAARIAGLPVNPPLRWIENSQGAAWSVSRDGAGTESWALYLKLDDPAAALREIEVEPGMALETVRGERGGDGVFSLPGAVAGVAEPWLILSGDDKLPLFALEAKGRPGVSMAGAEIVPAWRRAVSARGVFNPAYSAAAAKIEALGGGFADAWLSGEARVAFTARLGRNGGVEMNFTTSELSESVPGAGLWPLVFIIMVVLAALSLCVILGILLVAIGWGGWLKRLAGKAGVVPAKEPETVEVSTAFEEDAASEAVDTPKSNE